MQIVSELIELETEAEIGIYNLTPLIEKVLSATSILNGQALVFSRHTTTALAINEFQERLLEDL